MIRLTQQIRGNLMGINVIVPDSAQETYESWHFAPAVQHDDLIFFSGVVGHGESPEEEFRNAWASLGETLTAAGVGYEDIIDTTIYVVDLQKNARAMSKAKDVFIKEPYPASTWIGITELVIPGARAEIKVVARKAS
jgi:enamine deaminase RidA (YjgF/YER057c/UK114 family)